MVAVVFEPSGSNPDWQKPLFGYLQLRAIPDGEPEARRLVYQAKGYIIHDDKLYRSSTSRILQRSIPIEEGKALLLDIHEGICGHHASSRTRVGKFFQQHFYWPIAATTVVQIIRSC
jgi:hypothetical protein